MTLEQQALVDSHLQSAKAAVGRQIRRFGAHQDREELQSAAYFALVKAAKHFRPELGFTFKTFLWRCIEVEFWNLRRSQKLQNGWKIIDVGDGKRKATQLAKRTDFPSDEDGNAFDIPDTQVSHPALRLAAGEKVNVLMAAALNERDRRMVARALMGQNFKEIGDDFQISRERVRQLWERLSDRARQIVDDRYGITDFDRWCEAQRLRIASDLRARLCRVDAARFGTKSRAYEMTITRRGTTTTVGRMVRADLRPAQ